MPPCMQGHSALLYFPFTFAFRESGYVRSLQLISLFLVIVVGVVVVGPAVVVVVPQ
jgi:hypothetical protein